MSLTAPDPIVYLFAVNSPIFRFQNTVFASGQVVASSTTTPFDNGSAKIIYFTSSFSGFQFTLSYAPDGTQSSFGTGGKNESARSECPGRAYRFSSCSLNVVVPLRIRAI
jgi:hypothetical protein